MALDIAVGIVLGFFLLYMIPYIIAITFWCLSVPFIIIGKIWDYVKK